jgi:polygalacturonase
MSVIEKTVAAAEGDRTRVLQDAFDDVSGRGGGIVVLEAGVHLCGALRLRSNLELRLAEGAVLRAVGGYESFAANTCATIAEDSDRAFLLANGVENLRITGSGTIDGQGHLWNLGPDGDMGVLVPAPRRPRTLVIESARAVVLDGVKIVDSPMWTLHLVGSHGVRIHGVAVENSLLQPNTDGIVIDSCHDVAIEDCRIRAADDGVVLKTSRRTDGLPPGSCERVTVRRTVVQSLSCALKIGTESFGDFIGIDIADCEVRQSNRALGIFSRDGGEVRDVRFRRIVVDCHETPDGYWGSGEAITVNVVDRRPDERPAGAISEVVIEDVTGRAEGAVTIVGRGVRPISGVRLNRVRLEQRPGRLGTGRFLDLRPTPADLVPNASGRANAWTRGDDGRVVGLVDYPGGLPGVYVETIEPPELTAVTIDRPHPLPDGWNAEAIVIRTGA